MIKKYRRRLERMKDYEEEYLKVEFIKVEDLPQIFDIKYTNFKNFR